MTAQRPYSYTILRYLHDQRAGEMLNVGIVIHVPSQNLLLSRTRHTYGRMKAAFSDLDGRAFTDSMRAADRSIEAAARDLIDMRLFPYDGDAGTLARKAMPADDSAMQWSPTGSGLTDDPGATLDRLYERLVHRHDGQPVNRRTDEAVWRPVREKLIERDIHVPFEEKIVSGSLDSITFQHAWKNGRWHAYQPVSLDLADSDGIMDKTHRLLGHLTAVRDGAADLPLLHLILGSPSDPSLQQTYRKAIALLKNAAFNPEVIEEDAIDTLVSRIEAELLAHDSEALAAGTALHNTQA